MTNMTNVDFHLIFLPLPTSLSQSLCLWVVWSLFFVYEFHRMSFHFITNCRFVWFLLSSISDIRPTVIDLICNALDISRRSEHSTRHISVWISNSAAVRVANIFGRRTRSHSVCGHRYTGSSTMGESNIWRGIHCHQTIKFKQRS